MKIDRHPNAMILGATIARVIDAGAELDRYDAGDERPCPAYDRLAADANTRGLEFRQNLALAIFLAGNGAMKGSRAFDNCFENNDGDQVVAFLVVQSRRDSRLERAITADYGGTFPARWLETSERLAAANQLELI